MSLSTFTKYDQITGEILGTYVFPEEDLELEEGTFIEGSYSSIHYYIDNGIPIELPSKPKGYFNFDYNLKQWVLDEDATNEALIQKAKDYLSKTDWYYARFLETGVEVPADIVTKRTEARSFLQANGY